MNLENAINGVMKGIFAATGQTCLAGSRVLVHEAIREELVDRLTDRAGDIELGDPLDSGTEMGSVAFREQWAFSVVGHPLYRKCMTPLKHHW